jgi:hypothetical protein
VIQISNWRIFFPIPGPECNARWTCQGNLVSPRQAIKPSFKIITASVIGGSVLKYVALKIKRDVDPEIIQN